MKRLLFCPFLFSALAAFSQPTITLTPVITGLTTPMQVVNAGDTTNRIFVVQKGGPIWVYNQSDSLLGTFLTVTNITTSGERGLISMAFHPDYANNGFFYVYYTNSGGNLELARYRVSASPNIADANSKKVLITIPHPVNANHNGGTLNFGADGYLYLSTGDGGGTGDTANNAQNTSKLLGKLLRFAVDTSAVAPYYSIPADNPFGNEIYAYGLRNPFRWSFDRQTHDIWIGDVGQDSYEEINHRPADSLRGTNFGWRCYEGNVTYNTTRCAGTTNFTFPVYTYPTPVSGGSITGGAVYRGETYISLRGYYIATDYSTGNFYIVRYDSVNHTHTTTVQPMTRVNLSSFGERTDGEMYATCLTNGTVYRILSSGDIQYTFTGNGNWNVPDNWSNKTIPPATLPSGSEIAIRPKGNGECVLNVPQTISAGSKITVQNDKQFRIQGNLTIQ